MTYGFDRFLRYDELTAWLHETAAAHPSLPTEPTWPPSASAAAKRRKATESGKPPDARQS
jgi:hypothetical protein